MELARPGDGCSFRSALWRGERARRPRADSSPESPRRRTAADGPLRARERPAGASAASPRPRARGWSWSAAGAWAAFTGLLLGSVSSHLAHHAPCPVLIVRGAERGDLSHLTALRPPDLRDLWPRYRRRRFFVPSRSWFGWSGPGTTKEPTVTVVDESPNVATECPRRSPAPPAARRRGASGADHRHRPDRLRGGVRGRDGHRRRSADVGPQLRHATTSTTSCRASTSYFPDQAALEKEGRSDLVRLRRRPGDDRQRRPRPTPATSPTTSTASPAAPPTPISASPRRRPRRRCRRPRTAGRARPTVADLQAKADAITNQRNTLFKGETLRGLLLSSYAWATSARSPGSPRSSRFVAAGVMLILVVLGIVHRVRMRNA